MNFEFPAPERHLSKYAVSPTSCVTDILRYPLLATNPNAGIGAVRRPASKQIDCDGLDSTGECKWSAVEIVERDRRAEVPANVEGFAGGECAGDGALDRNAHRFPVISGDLGARYDIVVISRC